MSKTNSLRLVNSEKEVCALRRSHFEFRNWRIHTDGYRVWIAQQKSGELPTDHIEMPKAIFDRLLEMYERPQPTQEAGGRT